MDQRATHIRTNRDGVDELTDVLDGLRDARVGESVALELGEDGLNNLHNAVRKKSVEYKGDNLIDHMDAMKALLDQINAVRDEYLF